MLIENINKRMQSRILIQNTGTVRQTEENIQGMAVHSVYLPGARLLGEATQRHVTDYRQTDNLTGRLTSQSALTLPQRLV